MMNLNFFVKLSGGLTLLVLIFSSWLVLRLFFALDRVNDTQANIAKLSRQQQAMQAMANEVYTLGKTNVILHPLLKEFENKSKSVLQKRPGEMDPRSLGGSQ